MKPDSTGMPRAARIASEHRLLDFRCGVFGCPAFGRARTPLGARSPHTRGGLDRRSGQTGASGPATTDATRRPVSGHVVTAPPSVRMTGWQPQCTWQARPSSADPETGCSASTVSAGASEIDACRTWAPVMSAARPRSGAASVSASTNASMREAVVHQPRGAPPPQCHRPTVMPPLCASGGLLHKSNFARSGHRPPGHGS